MASSSLSLRLPSGQLVEATLNGRRGAKRMTLRVDPISRGVVINGPLRLSKRDAMAFLSSSADWIETRLSALPERAPFIDGQSVLFRGRLTQLKRCDGRGAPAFCDGEAGSILVYGPPQRFEARVHAALKIFAHNDALNFCDALSAKLGKAPKSIALRDTRTRWGSCTSAGDIMVSWRLIGAPPKVFEYVVAHELAHLMEMNHSPRFWAHVSELMPDWKPARAWLKAHGASLHALGR